MFPHNIDLTEKLFQSQQNSIFQDGNENWGLHSDKPFFYWTKTSLRWCFYRVVGIHLDQIESYQHSHSTWNKKYLSSNAYHLIFFSHFLDKPGTISGWMKNEIRDRKAKTPVVMWNPLKISAWLFSVLVKFNFTWAKEYLRPFSRKSDDGKDFKLKL